MVFFYTVCFFQEQQRFSQTSANVFLGKVDCPFVRNAQIFRQLFDEEHGQLGIVEYEFDNDRHRNQTDGARLECSRGSYEIFFGKIRPIGEILLVLDDADNLASPAYSVFVYFYYLTPVPAFFVHLMVEWTF